MIFWLLTALAVTPDELTAAVPQAQASLDRCMQQGCEPQEGLDAAYILVLHGYLETGRVDRMLAGTVEALDADLFATLPSVIRQKASAPMLWVEGGEVVQDVLRPPLSFIEEHYPEDKRRACTFTVAVVNHQGDPIPNATIRFPMEGENHSVNTMSGEWSSSVLYPPDGSKRAFWKGDVVEFDVFAAGYGYKRARAFIEKKRKYRTVVVLDRWTLTASQDAGEAERNAIEGYERWLALEVEHAQHYSDENQARLRKIRYETALAAKDWMDRGGGADAQALCRMTGTLDLCRTR